MCTLGHAQDTKFGLSGDNPVYDPPHQPGRSPTFALYATTLKG